LREADDDGQECPSCLLAACPLVSKVNIMTALARTSAMPAALKRPAPSACPLRVYFGHHKAASKYVQRVLRGIATALRLRVEAAALPQGLPMAWQKRDAGVRARTDQTLQLVARADCDILCLSNAEKAYLDLLDRRGFRGFRGFHVIRDPRDVLVSGYFSHRNSHPAAPERNPWLVEHRARLLQCDQETGLMHEIEYSSAYFEHLAGWNYRHPCVLETRFETLTRQPAEEFERILAFLGIELVKGGMIGGLARVARRLCLGSGAHFLSRSRFSQILETHAFDRLAGGRTQGNEDVQHHYRKGVAGDWRNHFTPKITAAFKERWSELLVRLGYEKNNDW
jgi:hypothetical protein